jgi:hypothetical protein
VIIQDADLEYDPAEIPALLERYQVGDVDAVFGSRILGSDSRGDFIYYWGGRAVTLLTRLLYGSAITDEATCYKLIGTELLRSFGLRAAGFDFCAELTAAILASGGQIAEVPISYRPRTRAEGKKISWRDGIITVLTLLQARFQRSPLSSRKAVRVEL